MAHEVLTEVEIASILEHNQGEEEELSSPRKLLFCWSKPDHPEGTHSYERFATYWANQLNQVDKIQASAVKGFPNKAQWENADLVVFNLTQSNLQPEQYELLDRHLAKGGALIVFHQGIVQRKGYEEWAERIGLAFSWEQGASRSRWGKGLLTISLDTSHEIFRGFPKEVQMKDELYWNFKKGSRGRVTVLGETLAPAEAKKAKGPKLKDSATTQWPAFWCVEHEGIDGQRGGRVFGSVVGHYDGVQHSPFLEAVIIRAFAWCLDEPVKPFAERSQIE
ncbi:MAG: ThuA domain-containing protein [Verrucomicrobiota bacterium JB023]|nr:ThuA domain-containing protein [Verrucomicrobiota bacterium JB023]